MPSTVERSPLRINELRRSLFGEGPLPHRAVLAAGAVAVMVGVALRFWAPTALWLDEALSVNLARLPVAHIPAALAHDGSPILYYLLLHFWIAAFGQGDFAVRAMSGVISVVSLPFFWAAGRRLGGRTVGWVVFFLALTSPFAINYATSARMYALMILLSLLGYLAISRALERPSGGRLAQVGLVTAAILYTHYWGLYLVIVVALWLVWRIRRTGSGFSVLRAMVLGTLLWLPWFPIFVFQALHTGTPWSGSASPGDMLGVFRDFSGSGPWGTLLMFASFSLFLLGTFGRTAGPGTLVEERDPSGFIRRVPAGPAVVIEGRPRPGMAPLVGIAVGTVGLAVILGAVANVAFVARYTAVILPLFLLVVSAGVAVMPGRRFRAGCVAVLCLAGLLTGTSTNQEERTQAVQVAAVLNAQARPGDLVIYCPDQLGPAVNRLIKVKDLVQITFPRATGPERVDWVDYKKLIASADVSQFAQRALIRLSTGHSLWLAWRDGYAGFGEDCGYLKSWMGLFRNTGVTLVRENQKVYYEYENLTRYAS